MHSGKLEKSNMTGTSTVSAWGFHLHTVPEGNSERQLCTQVNCEYNIYRIRPLFNAPNSPAPAPTRVLDATSGHCLAIFRELYWLEDSL